MESFYRPTPESVLPVSNQTRSSSGTHRDTESEICKYSKGYLDEY
jgi:hypothetical protein